jgi:DNA-binding CsgD family transcriptional regulator
MVKLSHRQNQVLSLLADGLTDDEIGLRLGISPRTARAHVEALKHKLGVARRREIPSAFHRLTGMDPFENET